MSEGIYLDNNATTKIDSDALNAMMSYFTEGYGNASSLQHRAGRTASHAIDGAREKIAEILNCEHRELIFTSGATESINMVLKGVFEMYKTKGNHIITISTEHKAVLMTCYSLEKMGAEITYLPVDADGKIDLNLLENSIREDTIMVCTMASNNETGVLHPITDIAEICEQKNTLLFCDATQYIGKHALDLSSVSIDILCFSAHKFHGPKGIGGVFFRKKTRSIGIPSLIIGGDQEHGHRAGTYNVPAIVGMAVALQNSVNSQTQVESLRNYFEQQIEAHIPDIHINGRNTLRISNTSNIIFKYTRAADIMQHTPQIAVSSGSACVTGSKDPSHVLKAMGLSDEDAFSTLRFSLSKYNDKEQIDRAIALLTTSVSSIRSRSPIYKLYQDGLIL